MLVIAQNLRQVGFNVQLASSDWGGVVTRRSNQSPPDQGGWNVFFTWGGGNATASPIALSAHAATGKTAWIDRINTVSADDPNADGYNPVAGLIDLGDVTAKSIGRITVNGIEHIDYLPIMNHKNYPIDAEKLTSFDVNKTIQRSTAKAIAMHGLGLALWTGEDLTDDADKAVIADKKAKAAPAPAPALLELNIDDENWDKVMSYVVANKHLGLAKLGQQLIRKYSINPEAKAKIKEAVES
jgi:hypothetical protein